jgi:hypothetical protein
MTPRVEPVRELLSEIDKLVVIGHLDWREQNTNFLGLAINHTLRRQREALGAAVTLADTGQGHLAIGFVRPALDEWLWLTYLCRLDLAQANKLLGVMGRYDSVRSLSAQRDYIGDEAMTAQLWYPPGFVDVVVEQLPGLSDDLKKFGKELGWGKGKTVLPSAEWLAKQVGEEAEYKYLHSATSRAVHFSAGEVMRRGWGAPGGILVTDKPEFREHLTEFALDRLWRLWAGTLTAVLDRLDDAGIGTGSSPDAEMFKKLASMGKVPLVHAAEWNLTPEGPLRFSRPSDRR